MDQGVICLPRNVMMNDSFGIKRCAEIWGSIRAQNSVPELLNRNVLVDGLGVVQIPKRDWHLHTPYRNFELIHYSKCWDENGRRTRYSICAKTTSHVSTRANRTRTPRFRDSSRLGKKFTGSVPFVKAF